MPLYPGTGAPSETGVGNIVNVPLAPGDGGNEFRAAFNERILPARRRVPAGPDHHLRPGSTPTGAIRSPSINLTEEDFALGDDAC